MHSRVGIVVLNYNNASATINCLKSIVANSDSACRKVVVVDNGSNVECIEAVNDYLRTLSSLQVVKYDSDASEPTILCEYTHLLIGENLGYARGNNCGCELLYRDREIDKILILNNDTLVVDNLVSKLARCYDKLELCGLLTPLIVSHDQQRVDYCSARRQPTLSEILKGWLLLHRNVCGVLDKIAKSQFILTEENIQKQEVVPIDIPSGSCFMVDKELFRKVGSFDSHTFLYYEENILCAKLSKIGRRNYIDCGCRCVHLGADTTATKISSSLVAKSLCDSVQYYVKYFTDASLLYRIVLSLCCRMFRWKVALKSVKRVWQR